MIRRYSGEAEGVGVILESEPPKACIPGYKFKLGQALLDSRINRPFAVPNGYLRYFLQWKTYLGDGFAYGRDHCKFLYSQRQWGRKTDLSTDYKDVQRLR